MVIIVSRTIVASAVAFVMAALQLFGIEFEMSIADQEILINSLVVVISTAFAIYFRYIATQNLHADKPLDTTGGPDAPTKG